MTQIADPAARRTALLASAALVLACMLWAGNFIAGRAIRGSIDPATLNFIRWLIAGLAFWPLVGRKFRAHAPALRRHWVWVLGLGLTGVLGFQQATYTALGLIKVADAVLLLAATPMLILASSALLGQTRLGLARVLAVLLSLFGVAVLLGEGDPRAALALDLSPGSWWALGAAVSWTIYTQLLRNAPKGLPGDVAFMGSILAAAPFLLGMLLWQGHTSLSAVPPLGWAAVLYVALGPALLAFLSWGYGVAQKGPETAGLYLNLMPVFAISLAWATLGEPISLGHVAGATVILAALILGSRPAK